MGGCVSKLTRTPKAGVNPPWAPRAWVRRQIEDFPGERLLDTELFGVGQVHSWQTPANFVGAFVELGSGAADCHRGQGVRLFT